MASNWWNLRRAPKTPSSRRLGRASRWKVIFRPHFDTLEDRSLPSTFTWTGSGANIDWLTNENRRDQNFNVAHPNASDDLVFTDDPSVTVRTMFNNFGAGTPFHSVTFQHVANGSGPGYVLNGNRVNLGAGGMVNEVSTNTVNFDMVLNAARGFNITAGTLSLKGVLSGTGGINKSGATTISQGTVDITRNSALGNPAARTTVLAGALLQVENNITVPNPLTLNGTGIGGTGALRNLLDTDHNTWSGPITFNTASTIGVNGGTELTLSGPLSGAALTKGSLGRLVLATTTNDGYTSGMTVQAGELEVNNSVRNCPITVNNGGTLSGQGTVGAITVNSGSTLLPGPDPFTGVLTTNGNLTLNSASTFEILILTDHLFNQVRLIGPVNRTVTINNAILVARATSDITPGTQIPIINNTTQGPATTGRFAGLPANGSSIPIDSQAFKINYSGDVGGGTNDFNDVVLGRNTPTAAANLAVSPNIVNEGDTVAFTGHLTDPDEGDQLFLVVDWGDGSDVETFTPGRDDFSLPHTYTNSPPGQGHGGVYTITATWFDDSGEGNSTTLTVEVDNVAPAVFAGDDVTLAVGDTLVRSGYFVDPGAETWTATVDYGDGSGAQPLPLNDDMTFDLQNTYKAEGTYQVVVTVTDSSGDSGAGVFNVFVQGNHLGALRSLGTVASRPGRDGSAGWGELAFTRDHAVPKVEASRDHGIGHATDGTFPAVDSGHLQSGNGNRVVRLAPMGLRLGDPDLFWCAGDAADGLWLTWSPA
jgi:hypothetical protein